MKCRVRLLLVRYPQLRLHTKKPLARAIASCSNVRPFCDVRNEQKSSSFGRIKTYNSQSTHINQTLYLLTTSDMVCFTKSLLF